MLPVALLMVLSSAAPALDAQTEPAYIKVQLPAEARLYIDDVLCTLTGATRSFESPELEGGKLYYYIVRAELMRDGHTISATKQVFIRPGATTTVDFGAMKPEQVNPDRQQPTQGKKSKEPSKDADFELSKIEKAILELTNREREEAGLKPLRANEKLFRAARTHSANMARQGRLAHELDGSNPGTRLQAVGYKSFGWGENCAAGQRSAGEAISSWMNSPGHRANLLGKQFAEIGIGVAEDAQGMRYYTQVFATPAGQ